MTVPTEGCGGHLLLSKSTLWLPLSCHQSHVARSLNLLQFAGTGEWGRTSPATEREAARKEAPMTPSYTWVLCACDGEARPGQLAIGRNSRPYPVCFSPSCLHLHMEADGAPTGRQARVCRSESHLGPECSRWWPWSSGGIALLGRHCLVC